MIQCSLYSSIMSSQKEDERARRIVQGLRHFLCILQTSLVLSLALYIVLYIMHIVHCQGSDLITDPGIRPGVFPEYSVKC